MSDNAGSAQIEDVLSSIRRLLSEESDRQTRRALEDDAATRVGQLAAVRPVQSAVQPDPVPAEPAVKAPLAALVLTPDFRVDEATAFDAAPNQEPMAESDPAESAEFTPPHDSSEAEDHAPDVQSSTHGSASSDWWSTPASDAAALRDGAEDSQSEDGLALDPAAEDVAQMADDPAEVQDAELVSEDRAADDDEPDDRSERPWNAPAEDAAEDAAEDIEAALPQDEDDNHGGHDDFAASLMSAFPELAPESDALDRAVAEHAAPDTSYYEDEHCSDPNVTSLEKHRDAVFELHKMMARAEADMPREGQEEFAQTPRPSQPEVMDPVEDEPVAEPVADDERLVTLDESVMDEEGLRDLVAQLVREELKGSLGERITRNVRKLVRREIHRALAARDFE